MPTLALFAGAAIAEIAGCFAFWAWLRLDRPAWWLIPGVLSLIAFALILAHAETAAAGRAYAAYGGIYVAASLAWLWLVEGVRPDRWDLLGVALCVAGTMVIVLAPHGPANG